MIDKIIGLIAGIGRTFFFIVLIVAGLAAIIIGICAAGAYFGPIGLFLALSLGLAILIEVIKVIIDE